MAARGPVARRADFESIKYATLEESWESSPSQGITSEFGPSLTVFEDRLLMAWRGPYDDDGLYVALSDEAVATPSSVIWGRKRV
jgi:hypothetical protein